MCNDNHWPHQAPHVMSCLTGMTGVQVIADITKRMGTGMAKYIEKDVETVKDYDEYCHFVAGLVGVGLSQVCDMQSHDMCQASLHACVTSWYESTTSAFK